MSKIKYFLKNPQKIAGLLITIIVLFLVGYLPVHFYSKKQVEGIQTQVTQPKIETPKVEALKPTETTPEPTITPTNKSSNTQSGATQSTDTPQPTPTPQLAPTQDPVKPCDEGKKYSAIDTENIAYNQYVQYETTLFNQINYTYSNTDCRNMAGDCRAIFDAYIANPQRHATKLQQLQADHKAKLTEINGRCY